MSNVFVKSFPTPNIDKTKILRYAGVKGEENAIEKIIDECLGEINGNLSFNVCYGLFNVDVREDSVGIEKYQFKSKALSKNLKDCSIAIIFGATIGLYIDRLIQKYGRVSPTKALVFQAIGAERIESLCDDFYAFIKQEYSDKKLRPRFSAGYGDFDITAQKEIFALLNCQKSIALTLNDSLMMSPSKSVTAIVGISDYGCDIEGECDSCQKYDCQFRR